MNLPYNVPIVPPNLQREETVVQIADVLKYLTEVTTDVFGKINERLDANSRYLNGVSERIRVAGEKVVALTGAKKATKVFSSSKYPAMAMKRHYVSVFDRTSPLPITRHKTKRNVPPGSDDMLEALQFYHVKVRYRDVNSDNRDGLGPLPVDVESVNDLLLYGTGKNPYKQYVMSDTLKFKQKLKEENVNGTDIGAAPLSISDRTTLTKSTTETYFYSPDIGDVPAIDVPLDLPDLPGIADDLRYVNELGPGIAPSVTTPNIPELPVIIESPSEEIKSTQEVLPIETEILPSPPPSIVEEIEKGNEEDKSERVPSQQNHVADKETPPSRNVEADTAKLPVNGDVARASLMEAIRQAGGSKNAKLRSAEQKASKSAPASGGDLMADLHAKLAMRRKGISGAKNPENASEGNVSAMDRISAMIPPPIQQKGDLNESTNTEDEDWD